MKQSIRKIWALLIVLSCSIVVGGGGAGLAMAQCGAPDSYIPDISCKPKPKPNCKTVYDPHSAPGPHNPGKKVCSEPEQKNNFSTRPDGGPPPQMNSTPKPQQLQGKIKLGRSYSYYRLPDLKPSYSVVMLLQLQDRCKKNGNFFYCRFIDEITEEAIQDFWNGEVPFFHNLEEFAEYLANRYCDIRPLGCAVRRWNEGRIRWKNIDGGRNANSYAWEIAMDQWRTRTPIQIYSKNDNGVHIKSFFLWSDNFDESDFMFKQYKKRENVLSLFVKLLTEPDEVIWEEGQQVFGGEFYGKVEIRANYQWLGILWLDFRAQKGEYINDFATMNQIVAVTNREFAVALGMKRSDTYDYVDIFHRRGEVFSNKQKGFCDIDCNRYGGVMAQHGQSCERSMHSQNGIYYHCPTPIARQFIETSYQKHIWELNEETYVKTLRHFD